MGWTANDYDEVLWCGNRVANDFRYCGDKTGEEADKI